MVMMIYGSVNPLSWLSSLIGGTESKLSMPEIILVARK
jgi:hypothetical protein